jgi:thiamine-phosphate pyrophosphorylase
MMPNIMTTRLYGILDLSYVKDADAPRTLQAMINGGVDLVQLRGKQRSIDQLVDLAAELHKITSGAGVPLIVNDHAQIAAHVPVEGVHVGQDDEAIAIVREKADRKIVVGKSTHSIEQAIAAQREGADYIGFGPIFATPTKPNYEAIGMADINGVHAAVKLPIFCIGGIKLHNLGEVIAAGATRVAIVSGLLQAPDITNYARACKKLLIADL